MTCGDWRAVIPKVVDQFLACGRLENGCHGKRLTRWSRWLDQTLLAPVPHRHVVLTLPKRLRERGHARLRDEMFP